jgi:hypothetical protein
MGRIVIVLVAAAFVAGCNDSESSHTMIVHTIRIPRPPARHGGFNGAAGLAYDKGWVICYSKAKMTMANGGTNMFVPAPAEPPGNLTVAGTVGCQEGAQKAGLTAQSQQPQTDGNRAAERAMSRKQVQHWLAHHPGGHCKLNGASAHCVTADGSPVTLEVISTASVQPTS